MTGCKRITYIDIAKILAMFLVVYTHTAQNIAQDNYMNGKHPTPILAV